MSNQDYPFWDLLNGESVLTIATSDACGSWSAPVLYAATLLDTQPVLYFLSSPRSRHIKNLPLNGSAAGSIYASYQGDWQAIQGLQMHGAIVEVDPQQQTLWQAPIKELRRSNESGGGSCPTMLTNKSDQLFFFCFWLIGSLAQCTLHLALVTSSNFPYAFKYSCFIF